MQKQEKIIVLFNLFYAYLRCRRSLKRSFLNLVFKKFKIIFYINKCFSKGLFIYLYHKNFFKNKFSYFNVFLFNNKIYVTRLNRILRFTAEVRLLNRRYFRRKFLSSNFKKLAFKKKLKRSRRFFHYYNKKLYKFFNFECFNNLFKKNTYKLKNIKKNRFIFLKKKVHTYKFYNDIVYCKKNFKRKYYYVKFLNFLSCAKTQNKKSLIKTKEIFELKKHFYRFFIKINFCKIKLLFKNDKKFLSNNLIFFNNKFTNLIKINNFFYNFFFKHKAFKKKKQVISVLFKRKNFFFVIHFYLNNRLFFVSCSELTTKKFYKYIKHLFKLIKFLFFSKINFTKIFFVLNFKKRKRIKNKFKAKNFIIFFIFQKILKFLVSSFNNKKLKQKIKVKYLYNSSHSLKREKNKKRRRK